MIEKLGSVCIAVSVQSFTVSVIGVWISTAVHGREL